MKSLGFRQALKRMAAASALLVGAGLTSTVALAQSEAAARSVPPEDDPAWLVSATVGIAAPPASIPMNLRLGGPVGISLPGQASFSRGTAYTVSLARQFEGWRDEDSGRHVPLRLELEGLQADFPRTRFAAGVVDAKLSDSFTVEGTFLNALVRIRRDDHLRWWLGGGVGRVHAALPDASSALPNCGCLRVGQIDGTVWRAKGRVELVGSTDWALVLEAAYTRLPALETGVSPGTVTRYEPFGLRTLALGLRWRF